MRTLSRLTARPKRAPAAAACVSARAFGAKEVIIRINAAGTPEFAADLESAASAGPDGILLPKIESADQVFDVEERLARLSAGNSPALWLMIETPRAMLHLATLSADLERRTSRVVTLVLGLNDLAKAMGIRIAAGRGAIEPWLLQAALAAKAHGFCILDGVHNAIKDDAAFMRDCAQARSLGLDGKTLIHPSQIEAANSAFSPSPAEIAEARAIVAAFALPEHAQAGVIKLDGRMVERLHLSEAEQLLQKARQAELFL